MKDASIRNPGTGVRDAVCNGLLIIRTARVSEFSKVRRLISCEFRDGVVVTVMKKEISNHVDYNFQLQLRELRNSDIRVTQ